MAKRTIEPGDRPMFEAPVVATSPEEGRVTIVLARQRITLDQDSPEILDVRRSRLVGMIRRRLLDAPNYKGGAGVGEAWTDGPSATPQARGDAQARDASGSAGGSLA
jgi:hypothetical protein